MRDITMNSREEFIRDVALDCLDNMSEKDKTYMKANPDPIEYHFSLGMDIRNKYIYGKDLLFFVGHPDDLSGDIVEEIIRRLTKADTDE